MARNRPSASSAFTSDFRYEYEAEKERWLRKRFLWYTGVVSALNVVGVVVALLLLTLRKVPEGEVARTWIDVGTSVASLIPYVWAYLYARSRMLSRTRLVNFAYGLVVVTGLIELMGPLALRTLVPAVSSGGASIGLSWIADIFVSQFLACLFLPLTPRESFRPLIPLLAINAVFTLISSDDWVAKVLVIVLSPLIGGPGALICWWRYSRFRDRFALNQLRGKYAEIRQELHSARQIHESLFPREITSGPVMFRYVYEPMRQIGGDYLYTRETAGPDGRNCLNVALLDVTGHGIPAALTVNRLHGELDRIFAENPGVDPGRVLCLLNRYVHLTLADHSVYVTALCFKIDHETDTLEYASGGHPPAFLRAVDGTIEQLNSTSLVLGAAPADEFEAHPRSLRFGPGDALIAYTDGATEARDANGRYLGVAGIQKVLAAGPPAGGGWPAAIGAAVDHHRHGPIADDTLVIEITRPVTASVGAMGRGPVSASVGAPA